MSQRPSRSPTPVASSPAASPNPSKDKVSWFDRFRSNSLCLKITYYVFLILTILCLICVIGAILSKKEKAEENKGEQKTEGNKGEQKTEENQGEQKTEENQGEQNTEENNEEKKEESQAGETA